VAEEEAEVEEEVIGEAAEGLKGAAISDVLGTRKEEAIFDTMRDR
jgi:hypothetical protein